MAHRVQRLCHLARRKRVRARSDHEFRNLGAILYLVPLALLGRRGSNRDIHLGAVVCVGLAAAWLIVHGSDPDSASALRLAFGLIAITITTTPLTSQDWPRRKSRPAPAQTRAAGDRRYHAARARDHHGGPAIGEIGRTGPAGRRDV
ncbi:MAG: hypothetical protein ACTHOJ_13915 [Sphingomonas oligoaromativorans]